MSEAPERIWIEDEFGEGDDDQWTYGTWDVRNYKGYDVEYVRAVTVQAQIDAAVQQALREVPALAMRAAEAVLAEFKDSQEQGWTFRQAHIDNAVARAIALIRKGAQP